jgi:CelD/BcsL family acetyltransferase involved in cellulose biosynthesis
MMVRLDISDGRWREFVARHPAATPFHHPAWAALVARTYGFEAFALAQTDAHGRIVAGLPMIEVRPPVGPRRWVSLPFTDHCPPLALEDGLGPPLVEELCVASRQARVSRLEIHAELEGDGACASPVAVTHQLQLDPDPAVVHRSSLRPSVRKWVARAERDGVAVRREESRPALVDTFYGLHLHTRHRLGVPVQPRRYFELLWEEIVQPGIGFLLLAYAGTTPIAGAVYLAWNGTVTYKYGASASEHWQLHPNHLLMWTAIRWACEHDYRMFDFGRSDLVSGGLRQFKSSWGAKETPLIYTVVGGQAPQPPGVSRLRDAMSTVVRRSPPWVCRAVGELLYRYAA